MAKGQVLTIASGTAKLITTQDRSEKNSVAVLNPNDGVLYLALNRGADPSLGGWDWKLPSQSFGAFPGPWESLGLYFLDQSGAGSSGELNVYDSNEKLTLPDIHSIGRALQARQTALDITEGAQPANPPVGVTRLWGDNAGYLYELLSNGTLKQIVDSGVPLGGVLTGNLPNPGIGNGLLTTAMLAAHSVVNITGSQFGGAGSTTSNSYVASPDVINYAALTPGSNILAFYVGSVQGTVPGAVMSLFLGANGSNPGNIAQINAPAGNYAIPFTVWASSIGANPIFQLYWAVNAGTLSFINVRAMYIMEFQR